MRSAFRLVCGLVVLASATSAFAVENEHHVGVELGPATLVITDKTDWGAAVGAHWAYGLSDAFNLMAEASGTLLSLREAQAPGQLRIHPTFAGSADVGIGYVFDVLRWVPYTALLVGGTVLGGGTLDGAGAKPLPDLVIALGLDYRIDRTFAVGVAVREHMLLTDLSTYPDFTQVFARVERTWGW